jgi:hypothetical protein
MVLPLGAQEEARLGGGQAQSKGILHLKTFIQRV